MLVAGGFILTAAHVVDWNAEGSMMLGGDAEFIPWSDSDLDGARSGRSETGSTAHG